MLDIYEIHEIIKSPASIVWRIFKDKPAESLTAILLLIGLLLDRAYRKKRLSLEIVSCKDHPQEDIEKKIIFRIINNGGRDIHLRSNGVGTFNMPKFSYNDAHVGTLGYEYPVHNEEETLSPGKSLRVEALEWKKHNTGGIAYVYAVDQTGKRWKKYMSLNAEIKYRFIKLKNFLGFNN